ncbi:MAG: c-type cytochrome [Xanthomonadales bacterium]|nr:c-type cytochrome [Xanthomonadales bacterium]
MNKITRTLLLSAMLLSPAISTAADPGEDAYKVCAGCHGFRGEGNELVNAPAVAALPAWYVSRQLRNYRDGIRGTDPAHPPGITMAQMALALESDQQIADVAAYIEGLSPAELKPTVSGDADAGRSAYQPCAACHGDKAQGNESLNAPPLAGLSDWYQVVQLKNFKTGVRGKNPKDTYGQQMAPMAQTLDENAMHNVVAFINTLEP